MTQPSAKSALGTHVGAGCDWLAVVSAGRPEHARAALARCHAAAEHLAGEGAAPAEAVRKGYAIGSILHDLEMDAQTVAVGVLVGLRAVISPAQVRGGHGAAVADLFDVVERLQPIPELLSGADEEKQVERLRRMLLTMVSDVRAALVLLAERLFDLRIADREEVTVKRARAQQTLALFAPLAARLGVWQLKWELEDLSLRILEPQVYKDIARQLAQRRVDRERYIRVAVERIEQALTSSGIKASVTGRPKHIYSIWRKMRAKSLDFHELFDVRAVRILTQTVAECYATLGLVHSLWPHVRREFDDYIANPKTNRYQSLHTAVIGPESRTLEVQIRTQAMHAHAERGVAAHWRYKEGRYKEGRHEEGDGGEGLDDRLTWLRQALEWHSELEDPRQALDKLAERVRDEHVYALTPQGRVFELPIGATPIDFAYRVHTDIGHRTRGARVDGALVPLTRALQSGQTVEILTARDGVPSRDWLNRDLGYLVTARARAKVRQWFRKQDYAQNMHDGREAWERELRRMQLRGVDLSPLPARFNLITVNDLFAAIGRGDVQIRQVMREAQASLGSHSLPRPRRVRQDLPQAPDVAVEGVGDLLITMARCCGPIPPEPIVGYITRGRGVSVHRRTCRNAERLSAAEPDRVLDVSWSTGRRRQRYAVAITVKAYDRRGLLRDVSATIADTGVDVRSIKSDTIENTGSVVMAITVNITEMTELSRLMARLVQVRNVYEVYRQEVAP